MTRDYTARELNEIRVAKLGVEMAGIVVPQSLQRLPEDPGVERAAEIDSLEREGRTEQAAPHSFHHHQPDAMPASEGITTVSTSSSSASSVPKSGPAPPAATTTCC